MSKPFTVTLATLTGKPIAGVKAHALLVTVGSTTHKLALHKTPGGDWAVTHPESGYSVVRRVLGYYRGVATTTSGYTLAQVRALALAEVESLVQRVGSDAFNAKLAAAPRIQAELALAA